MICQEVIKRKRVLILNQNSLFINAVRLVRAHSIDTEWRNRTEFLSGREEVKQFLKCKWAKELDYKLRKELWDFRENRMAVRFEYEWCDAENNWFRSYGNELWECDAEGLMRKRYASINDLAIKELRTLSLK